MVDDFLRRGVVNTLSLALCLFTTNKRLCDGRKVSFSSAEHGFMVVFFSGDLDFSVLMSVKSHVTTKVPKKENTFLKEVSNFKTYSLIKKMIEISET